MITKTLLITYTVNVDIDDSDPCADEEELALAAFKAQERELIQASQTVEVEVIS